MKILYVGPDFPGSNGTCWRDAFIELGHEVRTVDEGPFDPPPTTIAGNVWRKMRGVPPDRMIAGLNQSVLQQARSFRPDLIFFIKAYHILPETLDRLGEMAPRFVYMNDDMFNPVNQTPYFAANVRKFDCMLTTKSYNVREFHRAGAPNAIYIPNAYDPRVHYPEQPSPAERQRLEGDIGFIGAFRRSRANFLNDVARHREFTMNVWGIGWAKMTRLDNLDKRIAWRPLRAAVNCFPLWCGEMGKAIQSNLVMLGLLYRENRDLQTSRSFEIPACGGFMLAERTEEHRMYFEEDKEAAYFDSFDELISKLRFYISHESVRLRIARAGYQRCLDSPYRYTDRARLALDLVREFRHPGVGGASVEAPGTDSARAMAGTEK